MLDRNLKENRFIFVLKRLDQDGLYKKFDNLKVFFNCSLQDSDLGKILLPSVDELAEFVNGNNERCNSHIEHQLSCNIVIARDILIISMVMYHNVVLLIVTITITDIVLKIGRFLILNKIRE